jgi:hypothetical protein
MELTHREKFMILEISKRKNFLLAMIDLIYEEHIAEIKPTVILQLLNSMLSCAGTTSIADISHFKIIVADIKKINSLSFIDDNKELLSMIGLHRDKDMNDKKKKNILNVLKWLVSQVGFTVETFASTIYVDGEQEKILKYVLKKMDLIQLV